MSKSDRIVCDKHQHNQPDVETLGVKFNLWFFAIFSAIFSREENIVSASDRFVEAIVVPPEKPEDRHQNSEAHEDGVGEGEIQDPVAIFQLKIDRNVSCHDVFHETDFVF